MGNQVSKLQAGDILALRFQFDLVARECSLKPSCLTLDRTCSINAFISFLQLQVLTTATALCKYVPTSVEMIQVATIPLK